VDLFHSPDICALLLAGSPHFLECVAPVWRL